MVAGHLQTKKGYFYMVLNLKDETGKRVPKWIPTHLPVKGNKKKAEEMLLLERQKYPSSLNAKSQMLFADYMLYWLNKVKPNLEETTYASYESAITKRIVPYFQAKALRLCDVRPIDIQEFYTYCQTTYEISNNTIIHYHANLSSALKYALNMDLITTNPMGKVKRPKSVPFFAKFYTLEETEKLLEIVHGDPIEFAVLMAAFYGLRRSEVSGLRWQSIDFNSNRITINHTVVQTKKNGEQAIIAKDRAKNKASCRSLPLVPQFRELLLKMKAHQEYCAELCGDCYTHSDYIFVNDIGQPYNPNYITQHFALILEKNNLRKIRYHELRHSCASLLLKNHVSMSEIQSWLGHSTYTTTANFYAHLDTGANDKTGQAMADTLDISVSLCDQPRNMITNRCRRA